MVAGKNKDMDPRLRGDDELYARRTGYTRGGQVTRAENGLFVF